MSGHVVIEAANAGTTPPPQRFSLMLDPAGGNPTIGFPRSDPPATATPLDFSIGGLMPGAYWLRLSGATPGWMIKSIQWSGRDYSHVPFDAAASSDFADVTVTVTSAVPILSGTARMSDGSPLPGTTVLAFPTDSSRWIDYGLLPSEIRSTSPAASGVFRLTPLPAGEYYVVAFDSARSRSWHEAGFFAQALRAATRVSLDWGKTATVDLQVVRIQW